MLRLLLVLLTLSTVALSEESRPGESESKTEAAQAENQHGNTPKQITVPANSSGPTFINIDTGKHASDESQCAQPKNWKEWGAFAWCRSLESIDPERVIAAWTVILGVATCVLVVATWRLWKAGERQSDYFTTVERAFVHLKEFSQIAGMEPNGDIIGWHITPVWANSGNTQARDFRNHISGKSWQGEMPQDWDFPNIWGFGEAMPNATTLIGPKATMNSETPFITNQDLRKLHMAGHRFFFWGWATYKDVFSEETYISRFCHQAVMRADVKNPSGPFVFLNYRVGLNTAGEIYEANRGRPIGPTE